METEKDAVEEVGRGGSLSLKETNLKLVLRKMYEKRKTTKLELAQSLNMSIPTVTTCIRKYMDANLVRLSDEAVYTGGRKAKVFEFNSLGRIAIGVKLLKESAEIVATDLYGSILEESTFDRPFEDDESYYESFGTWVNNFILALPYEQSLILGVCIALQGLVSMDGEEVYYTEILKSPGISRATFQRHILFKVFLMHDLEASAFFELMVRRDIRNAVYFILNKNFGGLLILERSVKNMLGVPCSTIEHLTIDPSGPECYCGKRGCVESFCSADTLRREIGTESFTEFFKKMHDGDEREMLIWKRYVGYLASAINNVRMILNLDILLGGYLVQFMNDDDVAYIREEVDRTSPFSRIGSVTIKVSRYSDDTIKLGAALYLIDRALEVL